MTKKSREQQIRVKVKQLLKAPKGEVLESYYQNTGHIARHKLGIRLPIKIDSIYILAEAQRRVLTHLGELK